MHRGRRKQGQLKPWSASRQPKPPCKATCEEVAQPPPALLKLDFSRPEKTQPRPDRAEASSKAKAFLSRRAPRRSFFERRACSSSSRLRPRLATVIEAKLAVAVASRVSSSWIREASMARSMATNAGIAIGIAGYAMTARFLLGHSARRVVLKRMQALAGRAQWVAGAGRVAMNVALWRSCFYDSDSRQEPGWEKSLCETTISKAPSR
ncbi:MAG: hypothetical protein JWM32_283 [Verrucomicrobia bacterium]|nr:hypothetical protein [Verrucomicrobiota bacterium]